MAGVADYMRIRARLDQPVRRTVTLDDEWFVPHRPPLADCGPSIAAVSWQASPVPGQVAQRVGVELPGLSESAARVCAGLARLLGVPQVTSRVTRQNGEVLARFGLTWHAEDPAPEAGINELLAAWWRRCRCTLAISGVARAELEVPAEDGLDGNGPAQEDGPASRAANARNQGSVSLPA